MGLRVTEGDERRIRENPSTHATLAGLVGNVRARAFGRSVDLPPGQLLLDNESTATQ